MKKVKWLVAFLIVANLLLGVIGCKDPEIHIHTYSEAWTSDASGHWHASTCGHTTEVSGKAAHSFGDWTVTKTATEEAEGSKERVCTVCNYKEVVDIAKILEDSVLIPAGSFKMGSDDGDDENKPVHEVTITKPFYMGKIRSNPSRI